MVWDWLSVCVWPFNELATSSRWHPAFALWPLGETESEPYVVFFSLAIIIMSGSKLKEVKLQDQLRFVFSSFSPQRSSSCSRARRRACPSPWRTSPRRGRSRTRSSRSASGASSDSRPECTRCRRSAAGQVKQTDVAHQHQWDPQTPLPSPPPSPHLVTATTAWLLAVAIVAAAVHLALLPEVDHVNQQLLAGAAHEAGRVPQLVVAGPLGVDGRLTASHRLLAMVARLAEDRRGRG